MNFAVIGSNLDKNFTKDYLDPLKKFVDKLEWAYNTCLGGIVALREPSEEEMYRVVFLAQSPYHYTYDASYDGQLVSLSSIWSDSGQPYGAVDLYGAYVAVQSFPPLAIPATNWPIPAPADPDPSVVRPVESFFRTLQAVVHILQVTGRASVYDELGLPSVRNTLNFVKALVGEPPIPAPVNVSGLSLTFLCGELDRVFAPTRNLQGIFRGLAVMAGLQEAPYPRSLQAILSKIPAPAFARSSL